MSLSTPARSAARRVSSFSSARCRAIGDGSFMRKARLPAGKSSVLPPAARTIAFRLGQQGRDVIQRVDDRHRLLLQRVPVARLELLRDAVAPARARRLPEL